MIVITPDPAQIRSIQGEENGYYFSRVFHLILRKHGYIQGQAITVRDWQGEAGFVSRMTPWRARFAETPLIFESPLAPDAAAALGLGLGEQSVAERIHLKVNRDGPASSDEHCSIGYAQFNVRVIPKNRKERSDPFLYSCDDPLWNKVRFPICRMSQADAWKPILRTSQVDGRSENLVLAYQKGVHIVLTIPLLDLIVFQHSFPPLVTAGYYTLVQSHGHDFLPVERWLMFRALQLLSMNNRPVVKVKDWPEGRRACLTVRHDYDRPISSDVVAELKDFYASRDVKSTWFWLMRNVDREQVSVLTRAKHEVSLHSEAGDRGSFSRELKSFSDAFGMRTRGMTAHGGTGSIGFLGMTHYQWLNQEGLLYGEMLGKTNGLPHAAVVIRDGIPEDAGAMVTPAHLSLDRGMGPADHFYDDLLVKAPSRLQDGRHCILMNHPDIHLPELKALIDNLPLSNVWTATLAAVAGWVKRAKYDSKVGTSSGKLAVNFHGPLPESTMMEIHLGGKSSSIQVPKSVPYVEIDTDSLSLVPLASERLLSVHFEGIESILNEYFDEVGGSAEARRSTIITNTERLHARASKVLSVIGLSPGHEVAELGCGMGFLGFAIHLLSGARVTGYDINRSFVECASKLPRMYPQLAGNLAFVLLDYVKEELPRNRFDAIVANNTLCYVVGRENQLRALKNVHAALKAGGRACFYHGNLWHPREPFTGLFFLHWLPRALGTRISQAFGRRTLMDLHYQSPLQMLKLARECGFRSVEYLPDGRRGLDWKLRPLRAAFCKYYAVVLTKGGD